MRSEKRHASDITYRENNREKILQAKREWYRKNKEQILEGMKQQRAENAEEISARRRARHRENLEENRAKHREYYQHRKEQIKMNKVKSTYGLSVEEFAALLEQQGGVCAICGGVNRDGNRALAIDHDHETGEVRGLLCGDCNRGLGCFKDNPSLMMIAIGYLSKLKE